MDKTQRERIERIALEAIKKSDLGAVGVQVDAAMAIMPDTEQGGLTIGWVALVTVPADLAGGVDSGYFMCPATILTVATIEKNAVEAYQTCVIERTKREAAVIAMADAALPAGLKGKRL